MASLAELIVVISTETKQFAAGMEAAEKDLNTFVGSVSNAAGALATVGFTIAGVGATIVGAVGAGVAEASRFEAAMRNVSAILKDFGEASAVTERRVTSLSKEVIRIAQDPNIGRGPEELAKALYDISSSGFTAEKQLGRMDTAITVLEASARAASAGLTTTATAAKAIVATLNAYRGAVQRTTGAELDAAQVSDILFRTVDKGVISFEELATQLGDVIGFAAIAKADFRDIGLAMATMTLNGISAAEAATSLNRILQEMIVPSDALQQVFNELAGHVGASGQEILRTRGLVPILEAISKSAKGDATAIKAMFTEIRGLRGIAALLSGDMKNLIDLNKAFERTIGATQKALSEQSKSLAFQMNVLRANMQALGVVVGSTLLPTLTVLTRLFTSIVAQFAKFAQDFPTLTKLMFGFAGTMGLLAVAAGSALLGLAGIGFVVKSLPLALSTIASNALLGVQAFRLIGAQAAGFALIATQVASVQLRMQTLSAFLVWFGRGPIFRTIAQGLLYITILVVDLTKAIWRLNLATLATFGGNLIAALRAPGAALLGLQARFAGLVAVVMNLAARFGLIKWGTMLVSMAQTATSITGVTRGLVFMLRAFIALTVARYILLVIDGLFGQLIRSVEKLMSALGPLVGMMTFLFGRLSSGIAKVAAGFTLLIPTAGKSWALVKEGAEELRTSLRDAGDSVVQLGEHTKETFEEALKLQQRLDDQLVRMSQHVEALGFNYEKAGLQADIAAAQASALITGQARKKLAQPGVTAADVTKIEEDMTEALRVEERKRLNSRIAAGRTYEAALNAQVVTGLHQRAELERQFLELSKLRDGETNKSKRDNLEKTIKETREKLELIAKDEKDLYDLRLKIANDEKAIEDTFIDARRERTRKEIEAAQEVLRVKQDIAAQESALTQQVWEAEDNVIKARIDAEREAVQVRGQLLEEHNRRILAGIQREYQARLDAIQRTIALERKFADDLFRAREGLSRIQSLKEDQSLARNERDRQRRLREGFINEREALQERANDILRVTQARIQRELALEQQRLGLRLKQIQTEIAGEVLQQKIRLERLDREATAERKAILLTQRIRRLETENRIRAMRAETQAQLTQIAIQIQAAERAAQAQLAIDEAMRKITPEERAARQEALGLALQRFQVQQQGLVDVLKIQQQSAWDSMLEQEKIDAIKLAAIDEKLADDRKSLIAESNQVIRQLQSEDLDARIQAQEKAVQLMGQFEDEIEKQREAMREAGFTDPEIAVALFPFEQRLKELQRVTSQMEGPLQERLTAVESMWKQFAANLNAILDPIIEKMKFIFGGGAAGGLPFGGFPMPATVPAGAVAPTVPAAVPAGQMHIVMNGVEVRLNADEQELLAGLFAKVTGPEGERALDRLILRRGRRGRDIT